MPTRTTRNIAVFATVFALAGGLWWFTKAKAAAQPADVVTTSCRGFADDAHQLLSKGGIGGTFAAGDRVHLVIYFTGTDYRWESTGVFAASNTAQVNGAGTFRSVMWSTSTDPATGINKQIRTKKWSYGFNVEHAVPKAKFDHTDHRLAQSHGAISGFAKLEMDVEVATAGEGTIKINTTNSVPLPTSPIIATARCDAAKTAQLR